MPTDARPLCLLTGCDSSHTTSGRRTSMGALLSPNMRQRTERLIEKMGGAKSPNLLSIDKHRSGSESELLSPNTNRRKSKYVRAASVWIESFQLSPHYIWLVFGKNRGVFEASSVSSANSRILNVRFFYSSVNLLPIFRFFTIGMLRSDPDSQSERIPSSRCGQTCTFILHASRPVFWRSPYRGGPLSCLFQANISRAQCLFCRCREECAAAYGILSNVRPAVHTRLNILFTTGLMPSNLSDFVYFVYVCCRKKREALPALESGTSVKSSDSRVCSMTPY